MSIYNINGVSAALVVIFAIPLLSGFFGILTKERMRYSLNSLLDNLEFAAGLLASVYVTGRIFFKKDGSFFNVLYDAIPEKIRDMLYGQDILTYVIVVPIILFLVMLLLRLATTPLYRHFLWPLSDRIYEGISRGNPMTRRLAGTFWMIPKALVFTLLTAFLINFSMYYISAPVLTDWTQSSREYQFIYRNVMYPVLNSNLAKKIPVLVNDSFRKALGDGASQTIAPEAAKAFEKLTGGNVKIIEYFNGVTLEEAVRSNEQIDAAARAAVGNKSDDREKALLLYRWISKNIVYDYEKAEQIVKEPGSTTSGSIVAYETRKGICFDFSSLYVSMCRAAGLKVRLVTGMGYSGLAWGDHAWNQVYYAKEDRWINVDTTFGSSGANYFDKGDFSVDHRNDDIQGEWGS